MFKRFIAMGVLISLLLTTNVFAQDFPQTVEITYPNFDVNCKTALLACVDTGDILYEKSIDEIVSIASITKVMTLLLTFEAIDAGKISLEDTVTVSEHAYSMGGSQVWLEPGEEFTLDEMVKAICVSSANDAAVAVAEHLAGSETVFAELMNQRAQELGMTNTHFVNACGLDEENHHSTARDVLVMSTELLKHKKVLEYSGIWMDSLRNGETQLLNTNKMLQWYDGTIGLKTGTTSGAGVCISAVAQRDGTTMIAVVLGADNGAIRFECAKTLLDYGFVTYKAVDVSMPSDAQSYLPVSHGQVTNVGLKYNIPQKILLLKEDASNITTTVQLPQEITAPVKQGEQVGNLILQLGENKKIEYSITLTCDVEAMNFGFTLDKMLKALCTM